MTYLNACTELDDLGKGRYAANVRLRPVAYQRDGGYRTIGGVLSATGDAAFALGADELLSVRVASRIQGNAPLWEVRDRTRRARARWALEGANHVEGKSQGDNAWLFPEALPGADLSVVYGGHRVAADFALRKGHPKSITWRLDTQEGFDAKSMTLGDLMVRQPVLLPPEDTPWEPPVPLTWEVGSKGGFYSLTCALPDGDWTGWTLDPTLVIQPDAAAGQDVQLMMIAPNNTHGSGIYVLTGKYPTIGTYVARGLYKFDLSSLPDVKFSVAQLSIASNWKYETASDYLRIYRMKRTWSESQATWNNRSSGVPWVAPGAFDPSDCEQTHIASRLFPCGEAIGWKSWEMPLTKAALDLGYGWLIKADTETGSLSMVHQFYSSDFSTPSARPKLTVTWVEGGGPMLASGVFRSGVFGHKMVR